MLAGTSLRKQRSLGEVLSDTINILMAHLRQLAVIAVPLVVANVAFSLVMLAITQDLPTAEEIREDTVDFTAQDAVRTLGLMALALLVAFPIVFALQQLVTGAAVAYLDAADRGHPLLPSEALDRAQASLGPLVGAAVRATVIVVLLMITIIGIPFAIYRLVRWIFLAQVIMVEGKRGEEVLARSAELVQGKWWSTLGRLIVIGLVVGIPIGILQSTIAAIWPGVGGAVLSAMTGFISVPFGIIAVSLMFFHLLARRSEDDNFRTPA